MTRIRTEKSELFRREDLFSCNDHQQASNKEHAPEIPHMHEITSQSSPSDVMPFNGVINGKN